MNRTDTKRRIVPSAIKSRHETYKDSQKPLRSTSPVKITPVVGNGYLDQLFENAQEAIVMTNNQGRVLRVNSEFERLFGFPRDEMQENLSTPSSCPKVTIARPLL